MRESAELSIQITAALSRRCVALDDDGSEPLGALLSIRAPETAAVASPVELCLVLDASGSMHRFRLEPEQRELWRRIAEKRGDLVSESADGHQGWLWSGETLREMRGLVQTPMMAVVRGLAAAARRLRPADRLTVIAFADAAEVLLDRADETGRSANLSAAIARLTRGVDDSGLGRGSRLLEALRLARGVTGRERQRACRILVVSDGVVEDRGACLPEVEAAAEGGVLVSTIGVGDEFDEELLMRMADDARGRYTYAATAPDVEAALGMEVAALAGVSARGVTVTVEPEPDVVFRELFEVAPSVSRFNTLWMEDGGYRYRLGDLAHGETVRLLAEFALPPAAAGPNPVARVRLAAGGQALTVPLVVNGTENADQVWERDAEVIRAMEAVQVYLGERRAQEAAARADVDEATRHLRHTTRILRHMGQTSLAAEFESMAADLEAGRTVSLNRTKRLKAATRRLSTPAPAPSSPLPPEPAPRDLVHDRGD